MDKAINLGKNDGKKADKNTTPQFITVNNINTMASTQVESLRPGDMVVDLRDADNIYGYKWTYLVAVKGTSSCSLVLTTTYSVFVVKFTKNNNTWTYSDTDEIPIHSVTSKQDKTEIIRRYSSTLDQQMADNTIYNAGELSALTITLPDLIDAGFISQVNFTSGSTATQLTAPNTIVWTGDDLDDGVFVPAANRRYVVMFHSDGENVRGIVQGIDIIVTP